jgi:hypothetical protein
VTAEAISVFLSYSPRDKDMLDKLLTHLAGLRRAGKIITWHNQDIEAGSEWEPAVRKKLDTADIIVLLISADFINSDYCYGYELRLAIERHEQKEARVIPIILHPCDWNIPEIPFSKLNVLPSDAEPIISSKWPYPNEAFKIVAQGIREVIDQLQQTNSSTQTQVKLSQEAPEEKQKDSLILDELASEKCVNYQRLKELLVAKCWKEADLETDQRMCEAMNRQNETYLQLDHIREFPCVDLHTIDALWVKYSDGKFGFSIQKKIWEECFSSMDVKDANDDWFEFCRRIGWRGKKVWWFIEKEDWLSYDELKFSSSSPTGELPTVQSNWLFMGIELRVKKSEIRFYYCACWWESLFIRIMMSERSG